MSVLIDSSVWIEHFRAANPDLIDLLVRDLVLVHPMVLGELSCGTPPAPRKRTLSDIGRLRECQQASVAEVMAFIEREKLYGLGCGFVDITLLASTLITINAKLWTFDQRLSKLATRFGVGFST
jgi:predicted nucleic acid-binding protein